MTDALAALLRLTPFAPLLTPDPRQLCTDCLSADIGRELSGMSWGMASEDGFATRPDIQSALEVNGG
jgi:hypothetical protein